MLRIDMISADTDSVEVSRIPTFIPFITPGWDDRVQKEWQKILFDIETDYLLSALP